MKDEAGKSIGLSDAGQGWHRHVRPKEIALANVLHAKRVPARWARDHAQFRNTHAAYDDLPAEVKQGSRVTAIHDFARSGHDASAPVPSAGR